LTTKTRAAISVHGNSSIQGKDIEMKRSNFLFQRALYLGMCVFAAGCGGTNFAPVSGRVTLDDRPLPHATIVFHPLSDDPNPGPRSVAKTDKDGRYTLELETRKGMGAVVGWHKVTITAYEGDTGQAPSSGSDMVFSKALVPDEYNASSKLKYEVKDGGATNADFDLKSN
jgi:hypothetical protein